MTDAEILAGLQQVAATHLQYPGALRSCQVLGEEVAQDSLARLTLIVEVENHFRVCLADDEAMALTTVGDVVALLRRKLADAADATTDAATATPTTPGAGAP